MQSYEQEVARFAWDRAESRKGHKKYGDYVNLAKGAPALVMENGLMQALAYWRQKGEPATLLCDDVVAWLQKKGFSSGEGKNDFDRVMQALHGSEATAYMRATREALEFLRWLRHFAAALKK